MDKQKEIDSGANKALTTRQSEQVPTISVLNLFNEKESQKSDVHIFYQIILDKKGQELNPALLLEK